MILVSAVYLLIYWLGGHVEIDVAFVAVPTAFLATAFVAVAFATAAFIADEYKIKYWKILLVLLMEIGLLFAAFTRCVPHIAIAVLMAMVIALAAILIVIITRKSAVAAEKIET